jgi:hypothetical protein
MEIFKFFPPSKSDNFELCKCFFQNKSFVWLFVTLKSPKGSTMPPHHALSSFGKLSTSSALGGFLMFRPMVEELWNIEQFCD